MKHSKLPWKQSKNSIIVDGYPGFLARCIVWDGDQGTANANASFIAKACNNHKDLLDLARNIALGVDVDQGSVQSLVEEIDNLQGVVQ